MTESQGADQISLREVGRASETYATLLGYGARRGVNKTAVKQGRPSLLSYEYFGQ